MDGNGTKVLSKRLPPLQQNRHPARETENVLANFEAGPQTEGVHVNEIQFTQISEQSPPANVTIRQNQPSSEKPREAKVRRENKETRKLEEGYYIMLYQQQLSVFKGDSKEGELLYKYPFPHGAEYKFQDEQYLSIYDENGQQICFLSIPAKLQQYLWNEWLSTKLFKDLQREQTDQSSKDDFDEIIYSLKFNPPSLREFGNVYDDRNENYMNYFQNYPIVDGKAQIKNAVEFSHLYRPNTLMTSYEQKYQIQILNALKQKFKYYENVDEHMRERQRKLIQWAPSRDWSRLFLLSMAHQKHQNVNEVDLILEFYDFNNEKQIIMSSQLRINYLSQLLRPQWIRYVARDEITIASGAIIEASFTGDIIVFKIRKN